MTTGRANSCIDFKARKYLGRVNKELKCEVII